jgi:hypothetical protein
VRSPAGVAGAAGIGLSAGRMKDGRGGRSERLARPWGPVPEAGLLRSAPHTIHLVANSPTRVPQTGHRRGGVLADGVGLVIGQGLYQSKKLGL